MAQGFSLFPTSNSSVKIVKAAGFIETTDGRWMGDVGSSDGMGLTGARPVLQRVLTNKISVD